MVRLSIFNYYTNNETATTATTATYYFVATTATNSLTDWLANCASLITHSLDCALTHKSLTRSRNTIREPRARVSSIC